MFDHDTDFRCVQPQPLRRTHRYIKARSDFTAWHATALIAAFVVGWFIGGALR